MNQAEIERNITFIIEQQAKFFADIEESKALGKQIDARLDRISAQVEFIGRRLTRAIRLGVAEARQEREKRRQLEETFTEKINALIDAQIRGEEALSAFKAQVSQSGAEAEARRAQWEEQQQKALAEADARRAQWEEQQQKALAEAEARRLQGEEQLRQGLAAMQSQVGQALAQMAQAITTTNQRIDELSKQNGQA